MKSETGPLCVVPVWLVEHPEVTANALRLWAILQARYTPHGEEEYVSDPTRPELAAALRCSVDSIDRYLKNLHAAGAISILPQENETRQRVRNHYELMLTQGGRTDTAADTAPVPLTRQRIFSEKKQLAVTGGSKTEKDTGTSISTKVRTVRTYERFEQFWALYPRTHRKQRAKATWIRLQVETNTDLWVKIMGSLRQHKSQWSAEGRKPQFIPYGSSWLKDRCFEDVVEVESESPPALSPRTQSLISSSQRFLAHVKGNTHD